MALPPGINGKTVSFGRGSFFDGTAATGRVTVRAPKNVVHLTSGRPLFSGEMVRKLEDGTAVFEDLCPNDAPGLSRYDWTYHVKFEITGAREQPESFDFVVLDAGPDAVDGDSLTPVPSSIGTPVRVNALLIPPGGAPGKMLVFDEGGVAWGDAVEPEDGSITPEKLSFVPATDEQLNTLASTVASALSGKASATDVTSLTTLVNNKVSNATYTSGLATKANTSDLAAVATSGAYADLSGRPTLYTDEQAQDATAAALLAGTHTGVTVTYDDTGNAISLTVGGTAGKLSFSALKTAPYTAQAGEIAAMNVAAGATTLTLPSQPANGTQVGFRSIGATTAVPLTIVRSGTQDTIGDAGATSVTEPLGSVTRIYQYVSSSKVWYPVSDVKGLTALDARYVQETELGTMVAGNSTVRAAFVPRPTGGADGQALVKAGTEVVWGTVAGGAATAQPTSPQLAMRMVSETTDPILTYASMGMTDGAGLYGPSVVDVQGKIASPIARYYLLCSTDHAVSGGDGLFLATAPQLSGPWTPVAGALGGARVYQDTTTGSSTETPSIVWNPENELFHVYYQQAGVGGNQATNLAVTKDFLSYERIGTVITAGASGLQPGDLHAGYAKVYRLARNYWIAIHNTGGGSYSHRSVSYSHDGVLWHTDRLPYVGNVDASARNDRNCTPSGTLFRVGGEWWSTGTDKDYSSATAIGGPVAVAGPVHPTLTRWLRPPQTVWQPSRTWEASGAGFSSPVHADNGDLFFFYESGGQTSGGIGVAKATFIRQEGTY